MVPWRLSKNSSRNRFWNSFLSGNITFNQADNEHFRTLMSFIPIDNKPATSPGRTTLHARLSKYAKLLEEQLKELLKNNQSKISLALDCWSSKNKRGFLGIFVMEFWSVDNTMSSIFHYIRDAQANLCSSYLSLDWFIMGATGCTARV